MIIRHTGTFVLSVVFGLLFSAFSAAASITILKQPSDLTLASGKNAWLSVSASGTSLQYQWYKDGQAMSGKTGSGLWIAQVDSGDQGYYHVRIKNSTGSVYSRKVQLTVTSGSGSTTTSTSTTTDIVIKSQPRGATLKPGDNLWTSVSASGSGTLTYQWYKNGIAIKGKTGAGLWLGGVTTSDSGSYQVKITNSKGYIYSNKVSVLVGSGYGSSNGSSATVEWTRPTKRLNGETLYESEIANYMVYRLDKNGVTGAAAKVSKSLLTYTFSDLPSGTHYFVVTVVDTKGRESEFSKMVSKQF
ncbi:MAG: hypothetical protein IPM37_03140 [Hahellaceae bacterium]|nr:hypothetical protein [Hahellaceae bacterium]